jgi:hypothetical protein
MTNGKNIAKPWQKHGNFHPFSLKNCISVYINKKLKKQCTIKKASAALLS